MTDIDLLSLRTPFYLGARDEGGFDFDGRARRCTGARVVTWVGRSGHATRVLRVVVDPPLPGRPDAEHEQALAERAIGIEYAGPDRPKATNLLLQRRAPGLPPPATVDDAIAVNIVRIVNDRLGPGSRISIDDTEHAGSGVVARLPELLPSLPDRGFNEMFGLLCRFRFREGHLDVPLEHREAGQPLGYWLRDQIGGRRGLRPAWREALEQVPGWSWPALEGPLMMKEEIAARPVAKLAYPGSVLVWEEGYDEGEGHGFDALDPSPAIRRCRKVEAEPERVLRWYEDQLS